MGILTADSRVRELALPTSNAGPTGIALGRPSFITHFPPPTHVTAIVGEAAPGQVAVATNDWVVVPGLGFADDWETELRVSNRERFPITFQVFGPFGAARSFSVPPSGSLTLKASSLLAARLKHVDRQPGLLFLPSIQARVFQKSRPQVSGVLPSIRQSTLLDLSLDVLCFSGARRSLPDRSNLFLVALDVSNVRVECLSPAGEVLAVSDFPISGSLFLTDVLSLLSVDSFDDGQIRVTAISGSGSLWGYLATLQDGSLTITAGAVP